MTANPYLILGISALGLVGFGVLFYVGLRWLREEQGGGKKDGYQFGEAPARPAAEPPRKVAPGTHEVLRVLRDDLTGRVIVEVGGQRFNKVAEIQDPGLGRGVVTTVRDLQRFLQGQPTGSTPEAASELTPPPPQPEIKAQTIAPAPPASPIGPSSTSSSGPSLELPSMNPFKQMQVLRQIQKNAPPLPKGIPEQIDEVLQEKIRGTPWMRRGLKVATSPTGSVLFQFDGQSFEGVEAVPDPEIQSLIRAAIKEWEAKQ